jgi:acyl-CoA synthetase (AMP-forming)/AMP-acid ligase II/acyl carrier protein
METIAPASVAIPTFTDLVDMARRRAERTGAQVGFRFLVDGESLEQHLTYAELDQQARALAGRLQERYPASERALLLYHPGLEYISAFFGCLYAGMIPVPAYPPDLLRAERTLPRLRAIANDCQARVVLGTRESLGWTIGVLAGELGVAEVIDTDRWRDWCSLPWSPASVRPEQIAFLQYTSGSTGDPRGVMVSHGNLIYQFAFLHRYVHDAVVCSWLPFYHDLGLIGGVLSPCFSGCPVILFSPLSFIQRPVRWLQIMARLRATNTAAPNFALDLCVNTFRPEDMDGVDLSCIRGILTGAEPVRAETLARFTSTFAPYGFQSSSWAPSFGLAEGTLGVTTLHAEPAEIIASAPALEQRQVVIERNAASTTRLISCGPALPGTEVAIVDPERYVRLADDAVGEIWASGPGICVGYWNRPKLSDATFAARLADDPRFYLRTGDLGFLHDGQLYVTGRLKEIMIFGGRNIYPQDVEHTVHRCHRALRPHGGAAFSIEKERREQLVIVQEVHRPHSLDLESLGQSVRAAILHEHRLPLYGLTLIKTGTLPKTSSGKVQRLLTRQKYIDGALTVVRQWQFETGAVDVHGPVPRTADEICAWLVQRIAARLNVPTSAINSREPLESYVLDSLTVVTMSLELESLLGVRLSLGVLDGAASLRELAQRLAELPSTTKSLDALTQLSESDLDRALAGFGLTPSDQ